MASPIAISPIIPTRPAPNKSIRIGSLKELPITWNQARIESYNLFRDNAISFHKKLSDENKVSGTLRIMPLMSWLYHQYNFLKTKMITFAIDAKNKVIAYHKAPIKLPQFMFNKIVNLCKDDKKKNMLKDLANNSKIWFSTEICVDPAYRGQGIATQMKARLDENILKQNPGKNILLVAHEKANQASAALQVKNGFQDLCEFSAGGLTLLIKYKLLGMPITTVLL